MTRLIEGQYTIPTKKTETFHHRLGQPALRGGACAPGRAAMARDNRTLGRFPSRPEFPRRRAECRRSR